MSGANTTVVPLELPPSLDLPPRLSAHKYFFVCTLTVAAWDSLVLSPRTWKLFRTDGWPILKSVFFLLRILMPVEFVIVGVAFFDTNFTQSMCQRFYLFEPICTAVLLAACSLVHVVRIYAINERNRAVLFIMSALFVAQVVVTGVCCAFFRSVPLDVGQGCIAGPRSNWVGVYWASATALYTASFLFAVSRSLRSLESKRISLWKLMLRDGLNLYGAIWGVNMINMLFWFIVRPTGIDDTIKTTVTSMTAVLTTTMTLRIILSVRGSLVRGGMFAGAWSSASGSQSQSRSRGAGSGMGAGPGGGTGLHISSGVAPTYTIDGLANKNHGWNEQRSPVKTPESKEGVMMTSFDEAADSSVHHVPGFHGVQVTVQQEVNGNQ